jgi:CRP/FNR family transcriptional regulator, cyclic AMP receptor protein
MTDRAARLAQSVPKARRIAAMRDYFAVAKAARRPAREGTRMTRVTDGNPSVASGTFNTEQPFDPAVFGGKYGGVTISILKAGTTLYRQGETSEALFYVMDGQIQIAVVSRQGKAGILAAVDRGEFCGEGCLIGDQPRAATAVCITETTVARLERANVVRAVREDPAVAEFFLVFAIASAARLRRDLISQLFDSSEKRLARILLLLARDREDGGPGEIIRNVDQEALAQMIGTTRPRVNHFMNKFRRLGCIDYEGGVIVIHSAGLSALLRDNFSDPAWS